jgi:hypothetical protein
MVNSAMWFSRSSGEAKPPRRRSSPAALELSPGVPARPGGDLGPDPGFRLGACFLIDADQDGAGRRVQAQAADGPGPCPEAEIVGPVEPTSHLVRAGVRLGQEPADRGRRHVQVPFAQLSGK